MLDDIIGGAAEGGLFDGVFTSLFGSMESAGFFESVLGSTEIFGAMGGAEIADVLAGAGVEAGLFARAGMSAHSMFSLASDAMLDYWIWRDITAPQGQNSHHHFRDAGLGDREKASLAAIRDTLKSHSFMLNQLRAHAHIEGIPDLLKAYEAHGLTLPSEELVAQSHKALSKLLHPDLNKAVDATLIATLNNAKDVLKDSKAREAYGDALRKNPNAIRSLFDKVAGSEWAQAAETAMSKLHLRLTGPKASTSGAAKASIAASNWFQNLSRTQQGGLIFAGVAGVGIGVYALAKTMESKKQPRESSASRENWKQQIANQPTTHSVGK